jgi:hypothetical protein
MFDNRVFSRNLALLACLYFGLSTGCTSIRSTWYGDDGCQTCEKAKKHLRGVPTTLEVPTHLHVQILRTRYGSFNSTTGAVTFFPELDSKSVDVAQVIQKEIFTVDFKRPASGTLAYDVKFDKQYITKIENSLDDKTIASVANLISQVLKTVPTLAGKSSAGNVDTDKGLLLPFQEVLASEMFAINEPNLQERIKAFVDVYVNQCDRQCGACPFPGPAPACDGSPDSHCSSVAR